LSIYEAEESKAVDEDVTSLKRSYSSLSGWIRRKNIHIFQRPQPDANFVSYQGRLVKKAAWYKSPGGHEDRDLVRRYLETKATLEKLRKI
jgi:hypothetical protein